MKTIENVTLYKCDFCKKEYKRKHFCADHEKMCYWNPVNNRKCFEGCLNLERKEVEVYIGRDDRYNEPIYRTYNGFFCQSKLIYLLPPNVDSEAKHAYDKKGNEIEQEFMPTECDKYFNGVNEDGFDELFKSLKL